MGTTRKKPAAGGGGSTSARVSTGSVIAALRRDAGLAQEDVAKRLGLTRAAISYYESGATVPAYGQVRRILSYLGMDLHDLQDALDRREGRPLRRRSAFEKHPHLEDALLADTETLFRRWSRRIPAVQRPRLEQAESEVLELLRGLVKDLDSPGEVP